MSAPRRRAWPAWLPLAAWLVLLAALPWWLGLPLLLAMVAILLVSAERLGLQAQTLRRGLLWGLPGVLFALQRALGGDALAWAVALVAALAGFTLLAGLDAWLDRGQPRPPVAAATPAPEWRELARAPIGPHASIIELQPPQWHDITDELPDPWGGMVQWQAAGSRREGSYRFAHGRAVEAVTAHCSFSPDGRWFAARLANGRGVALLDRQRDRLHHLRGWQLCGWHAAQPWLMRNERAAPVPLKDVLGQGDSTAA